MSRRIALLLFAGLVIYAPQLCAAEPLRITVDAGESDRTDVIVKAVVVVPKETTDGAVVLTGDGMKLVGQLTPAGLMSPHPQLRAGTDVRELHVVIPALKAKQKLTLEAMPVELKSEVFAWKDTVGKYADLTYSGKPVLRYMYERVDNSTKERRSETFKVYHHVYNPDGTRLLTKGAGGLFPHHRGVFYGFNRISYDGKTADTWHCNNGESQTHEGFASEAAGPILARHTVKIDWHGKDNAVFAKELREITIYKLPDGMTLEFASQLTSEVGPVKLDGDPQHAGFQFRASQDVPDKTAKQTYYLRPDGKGEPGKFRNWDKDHTGHKDLPWNALSIVLDDQRYTVAYLDRPSNPKEARFSERDYGRFGSYFEYALDTDKPLKLNYRLWIQPGEMTVEEVEAKSRDFVSPPAAKS